MPNPLTERQRKVLKIIVESYAGTVEPVGSKTIAGRFSSDVSPATVRHEMAELEKLGLITHLHTSAGRLPTDAGYRYYVDSIMPNKTVEATEAALVAWEFRQQAKSMEDLLERTSRILSSLTEQAGWIVYPNFKELILKRIELIPYGRSHLMVVYATSAGFIHSQMVDMQEAIEIEELQKLNHFINAELTGKSLDAMAAYLEHQLQNVRDSAGRFHKTALAIARHVFEREAERRIVLDGSRYVLRQPEFRDARKTKQLCRLLESKESLRETLPSTTEQKIYVKIGRENAAQEIWDCSLITSEYHAGSQTLGTLGILGPRRMAYARVVAVVDYVARRLSNAIEELI